MNVHYVFLLLVVATVVCLLVLGFMTLRPGLWASWVDRENDLWLKRGWLGDSFAEKIKAIEKGLALKVFLGIAVVVNLALIIFLLHSNSHVHLRALLPPTPKPPSQRQAPPRHRN